MSSHISQSTVVTNSNLFLQQRDAKGVRDMDAALLPLPWRSLRIGESTYLCKVHFTDSAYFLLLSDLSGVWCEEAGSEVIQERSKDLNKRLKAPISSFLAHLSRLLLPLLDSGDDGQDRFSCQRTEDALTLRVKSHLSGLPFYWEFRCTEAGVSAVCRHLVRPLMCMTKALDGQSRELCALLLRKDSEIQDYQEGGAVLTRGRLKTDAFDAESFRETFLTENIREVLSAGTTPDFPDHLQRLYTAVTTPEVNPNPETEGECTGHLPEPAQCPAESSRSTGGEDAPQESAGHDNQQKMAQIPLAEVMSLTQRSQPTASKPKRKKAKGLFT